MSPYSFAAYSSHGGVWSVSYPPASLACSTRAELRTQSPEAIYCHGPTHNGPCVLLSPPAGRPISPNESEQYHTPMSSPSSHRLMYNGRPYASGFEETYVGTLLAAESPSWYVYVPLQLCTQLVPASSAPLPAPESSMVLRLEFGSGLRWDYVGLRGTTWDYVGLRGTTWDYVGLRGTTCDPPTAHLKSLVVTLAEAFALDLTSRAQISSKRSVFRAESLASSF